MSEKLVVADTGREMLKTLKAVGTPATEVVPFAFGPFRRDESPHGDSDGRAN